LKVLRLILASESARRVDLLDTAGYVFEARKSGFPELALEDPVETVRANAEGKALAVEREHGTVVLAADTIVYVPHLPVDERILGQASVRMRALGTAEVESYAYYGEGIGKAGGYAVQGRAASFVEWICGDYTNVVGLPLALTGRMLANAGIPHP
jgi:septum formation protein